MREPTKKEEERIKEEKRRERRILELNSPRFPQARPGPLVLGVRWFNPLGARSGLPTHYCPVDRKELTAKDVSIGGKDTRAFYCSSCHRFFTMLVSKLGGGDPYPAASMLASPTQGPDWAKAPAPRKIDEA